MLCSYELDHLDTASFTLLGGRHRVLEHQILQCHTFKIKTRLLLIIKHLWICPVPGVMAPRIVPGVALKTVNCGAS